MNLKKRYYQLSKEEFTSYLSSLKNNPLSIVLYQDEKNYFFYYPEEEINKKIVLLHQKQWELDSLFSFFSKLGKDQLIKSFLIHDILSTNAIEDIHSTSRDVFAILETANKSKDKELFFIVKAYQNMLQNKKIELNSFSDIRSLYDELIVPGINKKDIPNGQYFRKDPVYVSNGLESIHTGFYSEERILNGLSSFIRLIHQNYDIYLKAILSHFLFETIHPFYDGNGRLGRYIFSALLLQETNSVFAFLISSCIHKEKSKYYSALKAGEERLEFGLLNEYVNKRLTILSNGIESEIQVLKESKEKIDFISYPPDFSESEKKVFFLLYESTILSPFGIRNEEIRKESSISKRTLMYILKKLKEENKLIDTKFGRLTYHKIKSDEKTDL